MQHSVMLVGISTFTTVGYRDWKHALGIRGVFTLHGKSKVHEEAMLKNPMHQDRMGMQQMENNSKYVQVLMECVLYCSQQGIAFSAHDESENALNPGNLKCLLKRMSRHSPV